MRLKKFLKRILPVILAAVLIFGQSRPFAGESQVHEKAGMSHIGLDAVSVTDAGQTSVLGKQEGRTISGRKKSHQMTDLIAVPEGKVPSGAKIRKAQETIGSRRSSVTDADPKERRFGEILNQELQKYYDGKDSSVMATEITDTAALSHVSQSWLDMWKQGGVHTVVEIDLSSYSDELVFGLNFFYSEELYDYYFSAIGKYLNLVPFLEENYVNYEFTGLSQGKITRIVMPTHVEKDQLIPIVSEYKAVMEGIISIPAASDMTEEEKVLYLYQEIATYTRYTPELSASHNLYRWHTGIGTLLDHDCVCQGYAVVFNQAATLLGIDSEQLVSYGNGDSGHTWNAVRIDQEWYQVDVTWGDTSSADPILDAMNYRYLFFNDRVVDPDDIYHSSTLYSDKFQAVIEGQGTAFDTFYPKIENINKPFVYLDGTWYYTDGYSLFQWTYQQGGEDQVKKIGSLSGTGRASIDSYQGKLWFSDSRYGFGTYDITTGEKTQYLSEAILAMTIRGNVAYYNDHTGQVRTYPLEHAEPLDGFIEPSLPEFISILEASGDTLVSCDETHAAEDENGNMQYQGYIQSVYAETLIPAYHYFTLTFQARGTVDEDDSLFVMMPFNTDWQGWEPTFLRLSDAEYDPKTEEYILNIPVSDITDTLSEGILQGINIEFCGKSPIVGLTGFYLSKDARRIGEMPRGISLELPELISSGDGKKDIFQIGILQADEEDCYSDASSHQVDGMEYYGYLQTVYLERRIGWMAVSGSIVSGSRREKGSIHFPMRRGRMRSTSA